MYLRSNAPPRRGALRQLHDSSSASDRHGLDFAPPTLDFRRTWDSSRLDRKAPIYTCNRLTPMLAQQIKEEINDFKR